MSVRYIDFMFEDKETGEVFFVELKDIPGAREKAWDVAFEYFEDPEMLGVYSNEEAELLGYDTY